MPRRPAPEDEESAFADDLRPSKSALKRQMHDLQDLGEALAEMPASRLETIEMPELLREALLALKKTKSHEGGRRQRQYVGKLIRLADPEPLREAVAAFKLGHAQDSLRLHETERWRDELMANDEAITRWAAEHPESDLQQLRNLVRNARKDLQTPPEQRHGRAFRELFQFIKPHLSNET